MIIRGVELGYGIEQAEVNLPPETVLFADPTCLVGVRSGKLETEWEEEQLVWAQLSVRIQTQDLDKISKVLKHIPDGSGLNPELDTVCVFEADLEQLTADYPKLLDVGSIEELVAFKAKNKFGLMLCLDYYQPVGLSQSLRLKSTDR